MGWYPYRHAIKRSASKRPNDSRIRILEHPGYTHFKQSRFLGRGFASELNRYVACITDGLHLNYTIAKVFEIPSAGCLLLINAEMRAALARHGMFDGVHFLSYRNRRQSLERVVDYILRPANAAKIRAKRQRAQALVWRRHLVVHKAAALRSVVARLSVPVLIR